MQSSIWSVIYLLVSCITVVRAKWLSLIREVKASNLRFEISCRQFYFSLLANTSLITSHYRYLPHPIRFNNTSQQDFDTRKVYFISNVTFHAEFKYSIKIFPSPTFFIIDFSELQHLSGIQDIIKWTNDRRREWDAHVERMEDNHLAKIARDNHPQGVCSWGRPKKHWKESLNTAPSP